MKTNLVKRLTFTAIMIALSTVLSLITLWRMPMGGSITPLSMVPVCLIGIVYGTPYAIIPALIYGGIQAFLSNIGAWGLNAYTFIGCLMLDYILAFGALCLAGLFRKKGAIGIILGITLAFCTRFFFHFLSGIILFRSFDVFSNPYLYSLVYNLTIMLPELIISLIGTVFLIKTKIFERLKNI